MLDTQVYQLALKGLDALREEITGLLQSPSNPPAQKRQWHMSAAGRRAISRAMKARWRAKKKSKG